MAFRVARQRRDHDQQRHHRQILEQQDADDAPPVFALELEALGEQLDDDRRGRHGQRAAQCERGLPGQRQVRHQVGCQQADAHGRSDRRHDLAESQSEHDAPHRAQLAEREFEPDREHQKDDAEFAQRVGGGAVFSQGQGVGADQDADGQVAEHRRQLQGAKGNHAKDGAAKQQQGEFETRMHGVKRAVVVVAMRREACLSSNVTTGKFFAFAIRLYFWNECN
jgi:hypothetical protein